MSLPKPIPIQLLLYKMTTCLARAVTTLFVMQMKKKTLCCKTTTAKRYPVKKWEAVHKK